MMSKVKHINSIDRIDRQSKCVLHLSVGNTVDPRLSSNRIKELIESGASPEKVIDGLFILTLSRKPTSQETAELSKLVTDEPKDLSVYQDIFWALLNSTEFAFNR